MNWAALVAAALALWGWWPFYDIVVVEESTRDTTNSLARVTVDSNNICHVHVYPSTWASEYDPFKIVAHEVGHCLGIEHIKQEGIMNGVYEGYEFSVWDRAAFWHLYPAPHRVTIGMVATP